MHQISDFIMEWKRLRDLFGKEGCVCTTPEPLTSKQSMQLQFWAGIYSYDRMVSLLSYSKGGVAWMDLVVGEWHHKGSELRNRACPLRLGPQPHPLQGSSGMSAAWRRG